MRRISLAASLMALFVLLLASCTDSTQGENVEIENYILSHNLTVTDTSGVKVAITTPGSVDRPSETSIIEMTYTGKYLDNTVFDKSPAGKTVKLKLSNMIEGLKSGLALLGKGGVGTIIIPSEKGYGGNPPFGIRKNAVLIYEVTVIDF